MSLRIRAVSLSDLPAVAMELGFDPLPLMREAGIAPEALGGLDAPVAADRAAWLLDTIAQRSGHADLGVRLAMRRRLSHLGVAGLVLGQQASIREALAMAVAYRHLLNETIGIHLEDDGTVAHLAIDLELGGPAPMRQSRELAVCAFIHLFRLILEEAWTPQAVHFTHPAPQGPTLHKRFFGCPTLFGSSFNGFEFASADLDRINTRADRSMAAHARSLLDSLPGQERSPMSAIVRRLVVTLLPMGRASIETVAASLGRTVRTLQRELEAEGAIYADIVAQVRAELAVGYLQDHSLSVAAIAELLGYSCSAAFIRWFRARFGAPPKQWRATHAAML